MEVKTKSLQFLARKGKKNRTDRLTNGFFMSFLTVETVTRRQHRPNY